MLNGNNNLLHTHIAIDEIPKNVSKELADKVIQQSQSQTSGLAKVLKLKVDARVMLTVNVDIADRLINGQIGAVKFIYRNNNKNEKIYVKFDDAEAGRKRINLDQFARQNLWVPLETSETNIPIRINKISSPVIKRTQFPLMLSWAYTIHKVQGLGFDKAVISFDLIKQRSFNNGKIYVALSRVRSLAGMYLIGEFKSNATKSDKRAQQEYERMRKDCLVQPLKDLNIVKDHTLTVTLLNIRLPFSTCNRHRKG